MKIRNIGLICLLLSTSIIVSAQKIRVKMDITKVKTVQELTLTSAQELLQYGLKLANERQLQVSIAITDKAGLLLSFARAEDAAPVTVEVAIGKAKAAAYLKAPSKLFEDFINNGKPSMITIPDVLPLQGGIPIIYNNTIVGAVGVSGSTGETDNELATLIAASLK
ncbi:heme-binding protein [Elizabethkingia anophelis]|nr:heme-binding protein [Elizabethkingia anophelis]MCT4062927.1 heme-binding protein [Elizabethkingia anophelis]MCT4109218.1 heme-binding protein [Elizabethkingia anophelis]